MYVPVCGCCAKLRVLSFVANRESCFVSGANMVTNESHSMRKLLNVIGQRGYHGEGPYTCPYCKMKELTEDELYYHIPLYHANQSAPENILCPICEKKLYGHNFLWHLQNQHGPVRRGDIERKTRHGTNTHTFVLVVVRRKDGKFLLIQETGKQGFWLPGGRTEIGESLVEGAKRETKAEGGIEVDIKGVLKIEHGVYMHDDNSRNFNRYRFIFYGEPKNKDDLPKSVPNYDSVGAAWVHAKELDSIHLRSNEPRFFFSGIVNGTIKPYNLNVVESYKYDIAGKVYASKNSKKSDRSSNKSSQGSSMSNSNGTNGTNNDKHNTANKPLIPNGAPTSGNSAPNAKNNQNHNNHENKIKMNKLTPLSARFPNDKYMNNIIQVNNMNGSNDRRAPPVQVKNQKNESQKKSSKPHFARINRKNGFDINTKINKNKNDGQDATIQEFDRWNQQSSKSSYDSNASKSSSDASRKKETGKEEKHTRKSHRDIYDERKRWHRNKGNKSRSRSRGRDRNRNRNRDRDCNGYGHDSTNSQNSLSSGTPSRSQRRNKDRNRESFYQVFETQLHMQQQKHQKWRQSKKFFEIPNTNANNGTDKNGNDISDDQDIVKTSILDGDAIFLGSVANTYTTSDTGSIYNNNNSSSNQARYFGSAEESQSQSMGIKYQQACPSVVTSTVGIDDRVLVYSSADISYWNSSASDSSSSQSD